MKYQSRELVEQILDTKLFLCFNPSMDKKQAIKIREENRLLRIALAAAVSLLPKSNVIYLKEELCQRVS